LVVAKFVAWPLVTNRFVDVVFVPVAFVQMILLKLEGAAPFKVKLLIVALVATTFVAAIFVDVVFVKTPVDGVVAPIGVPSIDPPLMVAFAELKTFDTRVFNVAFCALMVVPDAVAKPNHEVDVPFVNANVVIVPLDELNVPTVPFEAFTVVPLAVANPSQDEEVPFVNVRLDTVPFVSVALAANKLVEVVFVPVALIQVRFVVEICGTVSKPNTARFVPVAFTNNAFDRFVRPDTVSVLAVAFANVVS